MECQEVGWATFAKTHPGKVRKVNEDSILALPEEGLWVVADGMGGHTAGDVASQMLVHKLEKMPKALDDISELLDQIEGMIMQVHREILQRSKNEFGGKVMGCTVVLLLVRGPVGVCMWAGDSRLYRFRGGQLQQMSADHSQVNEMVEKGLLKPEEARHHPRSNVITRAVGAMPRLFLDLTIMEVQQGDLFLLCSDGLYGEVEDHEIEASLNKIESLEACTDELMAMVLSRGAKDNLSTVITQAPRKLM